MIASAWARASVPVENSCLEGASRQAAAAAAAGSCTEQVPAHVVHMAHFHSSAAVVDAVAVVGSGSYKLRAAGPEAAVVAAAHSEASPASVAFDDAAGTRIGHSPGIAGCPYMPSRSHFHFRIAAAAAAAVDSPVGAAAFGAGHYSLACWAAESPNCCCSSRRHLASSRILSRLDIQLRKGLK